MQTRAKLAIAILLLIGMVPAAKAQTGASIYGQAMTPYGTPAANARIWVCPYTATGTPCTPTSNIYSDPSLSPGDQLTQPYAADQYGNFTVFVDPGMYLVQVQINQTVYYSYTISASNAGAGSTVNVNGAVVSSPNFNGSSPAPDAGYTAATWKVSGSNVIAEVPSFTCTDCLLTDPSGTQNTTALTLQNKNLCLQDGTNCAFASLTTNGTSGAASLTGGVLNIPQYGSGGGNGVQYNPSTTAYVITGSSINEDDLRVTSSAIAVSSWTCNGTACTVTTSAAHGFVTGDWVDVSAMTGWFAVPTGLSSQDTGVGTFQVLSAGLTSTQFEVAYTTHTGSGAGGSVYSANYWGPYLASTMPYLNGHGNVTWRFAWASDCANTTTFNEKYGSITGSPKYFIFNGAQNDLAAGDTDIQIEASLQACWQNAHNAGFIVLQASIVPTSIGSPVVNYGTYNENVNQWIPSQAETYFNAASGKYFDKFIDLNSYAMSMGNLGTVEGNSASGAYYFAERVNEAFGTQGGSVNGPPPFMFYNLTTHNIDFWQGIENPWTTGWAFLDANRIPVLSISGNNASPEVDIAAPTGAWKFLQSFEGGGSLQPWLDIPIVTGLSGFGSGGAGGDLWMGIVSGNGYVYTNALAGDIVTDIKTAAKAWLIGSTNGAGSPVSTASFWENNLCIGERTCSNLFTVHGPAAMQTILPDVLYKAAGTALPTCNAAAQGMSAVVSDATSPTYMGAYTGGGGVTAAVICSYNGTTYSWLTH